MTKDPKYDLTLQGVDVPPPGTTFVPNEAQMLREKGRQG